MREKRYLKLLVRPNAEEFEGVAEYLQRLAKANGFNALQPILDIIGAPLNDVVVTGHEKLRDVIAGKAPTSSLKIARATKNVASPFREHIGVLGNARVCCSCLKQSDVLASEWSEPLSISCSIHNEILLDKCPHCARKIFRHESQYRCKCGQEFKSVSTAPSPPWLSKFYELFAPWHLRPPDENKRSTFHRAEIYTARIVNKLLRICRGDLEQRLGPEAWIYVSDHEILENFCQPNSKLGEIVLKMKTANNTYRYWKCRITRLNEQMPSVFQAFKVTQQHAQNKGRSRRNEVHEEAHITSIISKMLKVRWEIADRVIRDLSWQDELRQSIKSKPNDCLLSCVTQWVNSTYSVEDIKAITGLSGHWLFSFCSNFRTGQLGTSSYSTWRFPKDPVDQVIDGIQRCLELGKRFIKASDGYIPLNSFPVQGDVLKKHTFRLVINGALPLVRAMGDSNSSVGLMDCVVPASAIELFQPARFMRVNFPSLIQYPELKPCLS